MANHPPRGHYPHRAEDVLNEEELEEMRRSEVRLLETALSGWLKTPDAPICEISPYVFEKCCRPYSAKEIRVMRDAMKRYSWRCYIRLFYNEGPRRKDFVPGETETELETDE
jgi:endonuclease/exonuclease/phosphatase (EEP) superfamily protein YafD